MVDDMKKYDELTNNLPECRDRSVADQKRKRKTVIGITTSLCCFCLVVLLGFGVWKSGTGKKDTADDKNGGFASDPAANNIIVINAIGNISFDKMNICIPRDDFVKMTREEMVAFYGVDYIPDVPADIKPWEDEQSGIYKRKGGTGEVYWDADVLNYSNKDFTRNVHLEVDKGGYVLRDYPYFKGTEEKSVINDVEVLIGLSENGYYCAEFMYKDVGFLLDAQGVTQDEFVAIIASVLE